MIRIPQPDPAWPSRPAGWRHDAPDPPEAFPVPWTVSDALLLVLWTILAQMVVGGAVLLAGADPSSELVGVLLSLTVQVVTLAGVLAWLQGRQRLSWRLLGPLRPRLRDVAVGAGVGLSGFVIVRGLVLLADQLWGRVDPPDQPLTDIVGRGGLVTVLAVTVAVVGAPVVEEVVFRGLLFQSIRERAGVFPAMGLSALVFGAVHLPQIIEVDQDTGLVEGVNVFALPSIAGLAVLGFWFAGAFHRTGRLGVVVAAHAAFNGIALVLLSLDQPAGVLVG